MKVFSSPSYKAFLYKNKCFIADIHCSKSIRTIECASEILMGLFSSDNQYIVLTTFLKTLEVYNVETGDLCSSIKLEKKCSAIVTRMYNDTEYLIMGDKVGDIIAFNLPTCSKRTFLVGHCATVITGLVNIGETIASSDRDEKVFVCHFPQTFNIQSICVGHKQYVSCIEGINGKLLTGSADGLLRCFDIETGSCKHEWYLDELLKIESEEETLLIPTQLFAVNETTFLCIVDSYSKILLLSTEDESFCRCIDLESEPVAITKDGDIITIFTKNVKTFELKAEEWTVTEMNCPFMNTLKEMEYVYEKTSDEQESGELFKQTVKNKLTVSLGLEKQYEHNNNKKLKKFPVFLN